MKVRYSFINTLLILILASFFPLNATATDVGGNITADTTWALANSPFIVTSNIQIYPGASLTIEPGSIVRFSQGTSITVGGELIAAGTNFNNIIFTSNEASPFAGDWGPIEFIEGSVGSTISEDGEYISGSVFTYCTIYSGTSFLGH